MTFRLPSRRLEDPMTQPRNWHARRVGVIDQQEATRAQDHIERYTDRAVLQAGMIAWETATASDQAVTSTTFVPITGSNFLVNLGNLNNGSWLVMITDYRVVIQSTSADDLDVWSTVLVDWRNDGTWVKPDVDRETDHGMAGAYATTDYSESPLSTVAFSLHASAVLKVQGGGTIGVAVGVRVSSGTANVNLSGSDRTPRCVGFCLPCLAL